jgi:DNA-directed RNA polymerase specialized sigma subunit
MFGTDYHTNVLDLFLDEYVKEAAPKKSREEMRETQKAELDLWHNWNNKGRKPEHLLPLYESYKPLLAREAQKYANKVEIPTSTIHAEVDRHFANAMKTFNPGRGTQLNTWVQTNLQKTSRYIKTYQNFGKIPEGQISQIRPFQMAKEELYNKLGHEPDTKTLADHLGWTQRRVIQMQKENRKDLPASGFESDPAELMTPKELEAIKLMQYDLTPEERTVYEYTFGVNGKPRHQPGQIAKVTNIHPSKVSRIRNRLVDKLKEAMELV